MIRSRYQLPTDKDSLPQVARLLRETRQGRLNVVREVTLVNGTTETTVTDNDIGPSTIAILVPKDAASAAIAWWLSGRDKGSLILGHADPGADRSYYLLMIG